MCIRDSGGTDQESRKRAGLHAPVPGAGVFPADRRHQCMLPYLMRYMGHSSLEKTYYYVHLIPDYFADYAAATENLESLLPEVEPYEI